MDLHTLRYLVAVADAGTVSAAAEVVRVTQPSLSRQLRGLERDLGVALFERGHGRLTLSPAGRQLLPRVRDLLARADDLRTAAALEAHGRLERITIAAPTTTLTDVVSPFLATLRPDDPVPAVFESDALTPADARRRGADLVLTTMRPRPPFGVHSLPPLPVLAYVPAGHPWHGRPSVPLAELLDEELIGLPPGHSARRVLDAAMVTAGATPAALLEASNGTVAQALAAAGRGIAVVSDDPRFGLHAIRIALDERTFLEVRLHCAWDRAHPAAGLLEGMAHRLGVFVTERYSSSSF
ncbi:LysR family transcriptional regulator [Cryptosporangium phraense]|uniref:LysR family transcriptional regulator n=1 Tax=Cryptosporangium phraense TaxID=2593070 RepID=A0A545ARI7_9ACTN|nr:LysR family transcriptional regulator [Cryptosporangium phraense]TQS43949.1 LysR family transcriptional regulator [Cryptosporangium phraense]